MNIFNQCDAYRNIFTLNTHTRRAHLSSTEQLASDVLLTILHSEMATNGWAVQFSYKYLAVNDAKFLNTNTFNFFCV